MLSFPKGAQDKEEARWSLLPSPAHLGRGQPQRSAQGSAWSTGSPGSSSQPGRVSSARPGAGMAARANVPCMARPCGRAPPPSLQRSAPPRAALHPLGSAEIPARCGQPLPGCTSGASPASGHKRRGTAEPDGLCQGRTMT